MDADLRVKPHLTNADIKFREEVTDVQRMIWTALLAVIGFASPALASPPLARHDASLSRAEGESERTPDSWEAPGLSLSLDYSSFLTEWEVPSLELTLGELPPETLQIEVQVSSWLTAYVLADLDAEVPRLDAVDGDTYFAVGLEVSLTAGISLYVEDFQAASGVLGDELWVETAPERSWDGHQIAIGARWQPTDRVKVEGAAVIYALSRTRRSRGLGGQASVTVAF